MNRTDVKFSMAFSTAMSMVASGLVKAGGDEALTRKFTELSLKAGAAYMAGTGLTPEIETLASDPDVVAMAQQETPGVAGPIEMMEARMAKKPLIIKLRDATNDEIRQIGTDVLLGLGHTQAWIDKMVA